MQTTPKANTILGYFFALLGAVVMLAIAAWVGASTSKQVEELTNPMAVPRTGHAATALSDGKILITGGHDSAGNLVAVSEIFDPATGNSTASATLTTARVNHTATLLADGRVLVAGGTGASGALSSAEIFDPANPGFQAVSSAMTAARTGHTATLLNNGSVLVAGGEATGTAEIFDPTSQAFTATTGNLTVARSGHSATLFTDDSVLLAGGNVNSMETFTPTDQKFTLDAAAMSVVRTGHWALEISGTRLLLFQGDTGNTIDEYNPTAGTITPKGSLDFHASSSTLLANGKVLVLGSGVAGLYDPDAIPPASDFTAFDETSVPGSGVLPRSGQSATQLSGDKKIFVAGGVDAQNLFQGAALFNPARIWTDRDDYLPDDPVVLSGSGWKANENVYLYAVDNETEAWNYESTVAADANGGFVVSPYFIVELRHLGVQFHVTALGAQSAMQADVKFTDAGSFQYSPNSQSLTIADGSNSSFSQSITNPKNNDALTAAPVKTGTGGNPLPTSWVTTSVPSLSFAASGSDVTKSWTVTVTVPSGTAAGTYTGNIKATATAVPPGTKTPSDGQGTDLTIIVPAHPTTLAVTAASGTYGGTSTNLLATLTSGGNPVSGKTVSFTLNGNSAGTATTDANGVATVSGVSLCGNSYSAATYPSGVAASFAGGGIYAAANGTASLTVSKATATVVVTAYNVPYDGSAHTATVTSITGVCGETGNAVGSVNVTNTSHTNAGTYNTDTWSFTGTTNYNNIPATTIIDAINMVTPTFSGLTASQTISCGTTSISLAGKLSAGAGPTQASPVGQTASITVVASGAPVATSTGFTGNAGNFSATVTTSAITTAGTYTIKYHYGGDGINFNAALDDTTTTLTVNSCNQPPVANCKDVIVSAAANCQVTSVPASDFNNGSTDPDGDPLSFSVSPGGPYLLGDTSVVLTVTDGKGGSATCNAKVTVNDTTAPVISNCPSDVTVSTGPGATSCSATASWTPPTATDNCSSGSDLTLSPDHASGSTFPVGETTVTYTAKDKANNTATCSFKVTVVDDTKPVINNCPSDQTVHTGVGATTCSATATWPAPTASDNCHVASLSPDHASGSTFPMGETTVTYTATDDAGNTATCSFKVTVVDNTLPVITNCPADITVNTGPGRTTCDQVASWTAPTATDNCHVASFSPDHNPGDTFPVGETTVTYTAKDDANNTATCSFKVTVVDNTPPNITQCAADKTITAACAPAPNLVPDFTGGVVATDNCGGVVTVTQTPAAGTAVGVGTTEVTLHVKDTKNNESTCKANLQVIYNFTGFFQPIDNIPTYNRVKAGSAIPIKFSLGCNQGLNIFTTGFPQSGLVPCVVGTPVDDIELTVNAGGSSLNYDAVANQYIYVWKTDTKYAGTCRLLNVKLADGTSHTAYFTFFK
jgi:HYR domain/Galactose oxidase, central domain